MKKVAEEQGAVFHFNQNVEKIITEKGVAKGIVINGEFKEFDAIIASSDYNHTETLLNSEIRNYDEKYWKSRTFAPSCLIYYLGFKEKLPNLKHHTLFFENDMDDHIDTIYKDKRWPEKPLFYTCCPSKTDSDVAPKGHENVFLLMPLATGLADDENIRERYFLDMIKRLEKHTGVRDLISKLDYKRSYCVSDFINDYNAYEGNAYGLANTLSQTAVLKPSIKNKHVSNLYYTGQLTVPGPGVPPSIISGKIVAKEVNNLT
jgi:phytoene desaturase